MASLVLTITETLRYRGAIGQWSWVLHRLTGLGVVLFLFLHVIDTAWAAFWPEGYVNAIAAYQSPLFTIGEFGLVFAVVYHALNGLRIAFFDFKPDLWKHQQRAAWYVLGGTVIILVPMFLGMIGHVLTHYGRENIFILPLDKVLIEQLPFLAFFVIGGIAALILAFIQGAMSGGKDTLPAVSVKGNGSAIEKFWWSFMRVSGILIVPLVFGHLMAMHVLQGVFDITLAGAITVGTDLPNVSGTAVEFVSNRWNYLVSGVAVWRIYDVALLTLVVTHGFNGLRYVLTDYTMDNPLLRRTVTNLTLIAGVSLLIYGGAALFVSVDATAISMAEEATRALYGEHGASADHGEEAEAVTTEATEEASSETSSEASEEATEAPASEATEEATEASN